MDIKACVSPLIKMVPMLILIACSQNILAEFAKKDTYEALIFEARKELNSRNFSGASTLYETAGGATGGNLHRADQADYASSYSGQCGLEFITLVQSLGTIPPGTAILELLMTAMPNSTATTYAHCITAESRLDNNIGDFNSLSGDENLLMAFNSFAKIGGILNATADADNDGTTDAAFDHCDNAKISDLEVQHVGSGFARIVTSLGAVGGSYADISDLTTACALPGLSGVCSKTDESTISALEIRAIRQMIGSTDYGVGSCGQPIASCPPCP